MWKNHVCCRLDRSDSSLFNVWIHVFACFLGSWIDFCVYQHLRISLNFTCLASFFLILASKSCRNTPKHRKRKNAGQNSQHIFFYVGPLKEDIYSGHLLCPISQSTLHITITSLCLGVDRQCPASCIHMNIQQSLSTSERWI